jgi:hypothetical protein
MDYSSLRGQTASEDAKLYQKKLGLRNAVRLSNGDIEYYDKNGVKRVRKYSKTDNRLFEAEIETPREKALKKEFNAK